MPQVGVRCARVNELVETGEVLPRLGRTIAERFRWDARQVKSNVADGNELTHVKRLFGCDQANTALGKSFRLMTRAFSSIVPLAPGLFT